jgi:hypothetical protein
MCPACMASAALMAGSVMSTGGVAALALKLVRGKKKGDPKDNSTNLTKRRNDDGNDERRNDK